MIVEIVSSRGMRKGIQVIAPVMERLTPNVVRHHTTHARSLVCVECGRALAPNQVECNDADEVVCLIAGIVLPQLPPNSPEDFVDAPCGSRKPHPACRGSVEGYRWANRGEFASHLEQTGSVGNEPE